MRDRVLEIVTKAVDELNRELGYDELTHITEETGLHGGEHSLDTLSLVTLIVDIEALVGDAFDAEIVLADEKAMSERNSPYRTVGTLTDFIVARLGQRDVA